MGVKAILDLSKLVIGRSPSGPCVIRSGAQRGLHVCGCITALLAAQLAVLPGDVSPRIKLIMKVVAKVSPAPLVSTALGICCNSRSAQ